MSKPQTFYAVINQQDEIAAGPYENANKAEAMAKSRVERTGWTYRVIAYTVVATFGGTDAF